jgi:hypothetical protein
MYNNKKKTNSYKNVDKFRAPAEHELISIYVRSPNMIKNKHLGHEETARKASMTSTLNKFGNMEGTEELKVKFKIVRKQVNDHFYIYNPVNDKSDIRPSINYQNEIMDMLFNTTVEIVHSAEINDNQDIKDIYNNSIEETIS